MSHGERQLPVTTSTKSISPSSSGNQICPITQASTLLDHHSQSSSTNRQAASVSGGATSPSPQPDQQSTSKMATQNLGSNPLQQEHQQQLKHAPPTAVNDTSWNKPTNDNPTDSRQPMTSTSLGANINNNNIIANDTNQKLPLPDNALTSASKSLNRPPHHQAHSQSHPGIFSPQISASLQASLASRVDQIIRTTLHDSPAYVPPTSKSSNNTTNNNSGVPSSATSSNMPSPSSSSTLIFNPASSAIGSSGSSAPLNILGHPPNSNNSGGPPPLTTASSLTTIYGPSTLPAMGDTSTTKTPAHSSASHSALAAAAALQSLNQSHVQRSQQQLAHTQQPTFLNAAPMGTKPPSNGSGTPVTQVPQAAHENNSSGANKNMPKSCINTSMANADPQKHQAFASERSDNPGDFASRMQPNDASNISNKMPPQMSSLAHLPSNWQEHPNNTSGVMPRIVSAHGGSNTLPPFASSPGPYGLMGSQLPMGLNASNSNPMISQDGDRLKGGNPSQLHDDKNFSPNFNNSLLKQGSVPSFDSLRAPHTSLGNIESRLQSHQQAGPEIQERITEEKLAIFAYNLLSAALPGTNRCKKIIHMDDEMRDSIQNGEFYTKYDHIATGILTNTILVPNFSIIDYLRRDKFSFQEVERIERVNRKLSVSNFACLMELVRQRPFIPSTHKPPSGIEMTRPTFTDSVPIGLNMGFQPDNAIGNPQGPFARSGNQLMSSSPIKNDTGPQGVDKSLRSSQSPGDNSRSQVRSNNTNMKFLNVQNQFPPGPYNPPHNSPLAGNQFGPSAYTINQKNHQQLISPQTSRSSPFQQPISICPQVMTEPPRSHSTMGALNIGSFNTPFNQSTMRQPPAAHQSSSRPNLAALASEVLPAHAQSNTVPVTAHMSSKIPQTPRLPDSLVSAPTQAKGALSANASFANKPLVGRESNNSGHSDFSNQPVRQELDSMHGLPIQTLLSLRQQEISNRDPTSKRSIPPHYPSSGAPNIGPVGLYNMELSRQEITDNQYGSMPPQNPPQLNGQNNNPLGLANIPAHRNSNLPNAGSKAHFNTMPPPTTASSLDHHRQIPNDVSGKGPPNMLGANTGTNDPQLNQYDSLMSAYQQQQIMLSNKLIDNGPGALPPSNMTGRAPVQGTNSNQSRLVINEPVSVEEVQAKSSQPPISSPKATNQRSIITGSASSGSKKSKKAKVSPVAANQVSDEKQSASDEKTSFASDMGNSTLPENSGRSESSLHTATVGGLQNESAHVVAQGAQLEANPAPGAHVIVSEINASSTSSKLGHLSTLSTLPNISDQSISAGEKSIDESSLLESDTRFSTSLNDSNLQNSCSSQPSKYQKIFTKKAWLKNYDEEDQAKSLEQIPTAVNEKLIEQAGITKAESAPQSPTGDMVSKSPVPKPNDSSKNGKAPKSEIKKKVKDAKTKSNSNASTMRPSRASNKGNENDSEGTTTSTPDLDDTDETDSIKSSSDKKLRRMPRRKVKSNPERDAADLATNKDVRPKINKDAKDVRDRDVARKRGIKDKTSDIKRKYSSDDDSVKQKSKKIKEEEIEKTDVSPSKNKKRSGEKFLQVQPCYEIVPKAIRCLECRRVRQPSFKGDKVLQSKSTRSNWDDFCRFFEFRKLRYNKSGQIVVAGFSDSSDAKKTDEQLWLPNQNEVPTNITYKVAKYIIENIGDEFCNLVLQERSVIKTYETKSGDKRTTWKRAVNGLRELCDVCSTTLFNCHYVCERCGFVVCIDCLKSRADNQDVKEVEDDVDKETGDSGDNSHDVSDPPAVTAKKSKKDSFGWIFCAKSEEHSYDKLALAKIIAGDCLEDVWALLHKTRQRLNLKPCSCTIGGASISIDRPPIDISNVKRENEVENDVSHSTLKGLLLATSDSLQNGSVSIDENSPDKDLNNKDVEQNDPDNKTFDFAQEEDSQDDSEQVSAAIEGCIASLNIEGPDCPGTKPTDEAKFADQTHLKLCDGDLLVLSHSRHKENTRLFREHWKQSKPVLVRNIHKRMDISMWLPQFFSGKFGEYRSDLVDCRNGDIHRQSMRKYWDGFEPNPAKKRNKEDIVPGHIPVASNEEPSAVSTNYYGGSALWRLKDWPPGQDFKEILPEHYEDFMNNLPLNSYTTRTGRLNLACRLPKEMVKPDLGPKMYSAYGTTKFPERGTTNLHLDISDAVNVMVYVGGATPFNQGSTDYAEAYENTLDECHVDELMKTRIREQKLIPGALWHIFRPSDVHKMREFLNKVSDECKISHEKRTDPIHDQIWYLDQNLLDRLYKEYGVKSYPILQCMGDAILVPAGAPHQVKNLQNCIKVANDFVSPENVRYCLQLTNEFRNLPETHINQEDKLQIKNILYHSVKESIQYIDLYESGKVAAEDEPLDEDDF